MLKKVFTIGVFIVVGLSLLSLSGCYRFRSPEQKENWLKRKIHAQLDLNESQKTHMDAIVNELLNQKEKMKTDYASSKATLMAELQKPNIDPNALQEIVDQKVAVMNDLATLFIKRFSEFHATLSPEQRQKLVDFFVKLDKDRHDKEGHRWHQRWN